MTTTPLLDRAAKIKVSGKTISYVVEDYTPSTPGAQVPDSSINFTVRHVPVRKVASLTVITQSLAEDAPALKSLTDVAYGRLEETIDRELFDTIVDQATRHKPGPFHKVWREIVTAMIAVETESGLAPDFLLTTPDIRRKLLRTGRSVFGLSPEPYVDLGPGQILVGCSSGFGVALRDDPTVETSNTHQDYFIRNLWALRVEQGAAPLVYRPTSLVLVQTRAWPEKIARWRRDKVLATTRRLRAVKYWIKDELRKPVFG